MEGILMCMIQCDLELMGVGLVIFDEFYECSLQVDLVLVLLLDVQQGLCDDFKLLIMLVIFDNDCLQCLLLEVLVVVLEGCVYLVECCFSLFFVYQCFDEVVVVVVVEFLWYEQGLMLLFLFGVGEIQCVLEQLMECVVEDVIFCLLYGVLFLSEQCKVIFLVLVGKCKVVLVINIVEISLIIEGICLVVDSVQEWVVCFDLCIGLIWLVMQCISQVLMMQCVGCVGCFFLGICLYLFGKEQVEWVVVQSELEILYSDLLVLLLELLQWGCYDLVVLVWLDQLFVVNLVVVCCLLEVLLVLDGEWLLVFGCKMVVFGNELWLVVMLVVVQIDDEVVIVVKLVVIFEELLCGGLVDLGVVFFCQQVNWQQ